MKLKPLIALPVVLAALTLAGCADKTPEQHIASAKESLQKNDTGAAVIELKSALHKNVHSGEARFLLGSTLLNKGNPQTAEVELRKAQEANYPAAEVVPELARALVMLGQAKKAVDEFGLVQLGVPAADAKLQTSLAVAYGALGRAEQAQSALAAALAADPQYAEALLLSARQKAAARDIDGALTVVDDIVARDPGNADAWEFKGDVLLYVKNQPEEALASYRKALASDPKLLAAHVVVFDVLMRQRKLDEAAKQLEELKKFAGRNPQTRFMEAQLAYYKNETKAARDLAQELLQQSPNNVRVLELAGAVELQAGIPIQAETYLARALQLAPENTLARRLLIVSHLRSGQPAKALGELNVLTGRGDVPPALYSLAGEVHLLNGDAKRAEGYFAEALKLDPKDAKKRTALAVTRLAGGKGEAAVAELQDIAASDSGAAADMLVISAHLVARDYAKALAAIDKLEAKQPDRPLAAYQRGRVLLAQKDNAGARKSFERALGIDPSYFAAAASLAQLDLADKKPDDAKKRFEALLAKNPKNGQALLALSQLADNQKAPKEEVAGLLGKAIDANPTDPAPRLRLIELHLRTNDNKQALATAQGALAAVPTSTDLLAALGRLQLASGETNQAAATFVKLVAQQPLSPGAQILLAGAQMANKEPQAARQSLRKALDLKPDELDAQRALFALDLEARNYADASKTARTVREQRPKSPVGFVLEGDIGNARKDWDAAARAYRSALQRGAAPEIATRLHAVLLAAGKGGDADRFATTWQKEHPKDAVFLTYLGEQALLRKDYLTAERHYLAALSIQPNSVIVLNNLAWVTRHQKKDGALDYAEKANRLAPNQPTFMDTLAMLLADQGDFKRAVEVQTKALELQPKNADLQLNLAKIYIKSGDKTRAKGELEALEKLGDTFASRAEVMAMLKTL
jgi:putative PEP-CTERM system TPR-repeat lipoprotein